MTPAAALTPDEITERLRAALGAGVDQETGQGMITVTVPPQVWAAALACARDELDCDFFDWLAGVDELDAGIAVLAHVYSLPRGHHLLLRTLLADGTALATATGIYRGAAWHERETHEMFGVVFDGHPGLHPLLLPDGFEQVPLRKNFVLAARRERDWPGAKEPGETTAARVRRRPPPPAIHDGWPAS